jgi:hypothetical protein
VTKKRLLLAGFAIIALLGVAWLVSNARLVDRAVELISENGEKQLREPMRPPRGTERVLLFALDGVGEDELLHALRSHAMPITAAALGASADGTFTRAWAVPGVLSILPSTTLAAWTSIFTGEPPARSGVPGNEWYDRIERRFYAPAPVTIEDAHDALAVYTDGLLGSAVRVPTLYELADVRSYVALSQLHRGADLLLLPSLRDLDDVVVAAAAGLADADESVRQETFSRIDRAAVDRVIEAVETHGIADLQVIYFPGVDLYTHVASQAIPDQLRYLAEVVDSAVGRVLDSYRRANALDDTWIVFVSDHGHTPVIDDDRHALGTEGEHEPPALLERIGFRMRPFELELDDDERDYQATVAYQGAMAYVYLADRSTCAEPGAQCDWSRPPRMNEDVLEVVRAFDAANRTGAHVGALRGTLDLILARTPLPPTGDALPFEIWDGTALVPVRQYLARNPRPDLLDLAARLEGLAAGPYGYRAGDVLLIARSGGERPIEDRFYFSSLYRSWHGSPAAQDSRIPLIIGRATSSPDEIRSHVTTAIGSTPTQLDVMRLVLSLLQK